ncbi:hypothetical protein [Tardiphaga sp. P5_C7]
MTGFPSEDEALLGENRKKAEVPPAVARLCEALAPVINEFVERSVQQSLGVLSHRVTVLEKRWQQTGEVVP